MLLVAISCTFWIVSKPGRNTQVVSQLAQIRLVTCLGRAGTGWVLRGEWRSMLLASYVGTVGVERALRR